MTHRGRCCGFITFTSVMAAVALVQGASRGLGLEFCRNILLNKAPGALIATCRNPDNAAELMSLVAQHPGKVTVLKLDVNREDDIQRAAEHVKKAFGKVDLIINSSAMLHPSGKGETSLKDVSAQGIISTLTTNTVGPLVMAKYFAPLLQKGSGAFGQQPPEKAKQHSGIIVNITAKVGSIGDNGLGGWYSYRMSKAALNMATRNLSIELGRSRPRVVCVSLHPGTVNTDLSRPYHKNVPKDKLFSTGHSVHCLMSIIDSLNIDKTGKAYNWNGSELPW
ncbi:C-factor [Salvelinus fontinalis]|uniref:C-factor n=1 Tax=Salvelinus fontinalis TaxID=8038 RepID=UPI0024864F6C|nr:C-factor [Salvelinus fontinalis]